MRQTISSRRPPERRGIAAVEFAFVAPILVLLTFGLFEVGAIMMVKNSLTQAARIGAREATLPGATTEKVNDRVAEELKLLSLTTAKVETDPVNIAQTPPGSNVTVTVRIDPTTVNWLPRVIGITMPEINAQATMRRETTH